MSRPFNRCPLLLSLPGKGKDEAKGVSPLLSQPESLAWLTGAHGKTVTGKRFLPLRCRSRTRNVEEGRAAEGGLGLSLRVGGYVSESPAGDSQASPTAGAVSLLLEFLSRRGGEVSLYMETRSRLIAR